MTSRRAKRRRQHSKECRKREKRGVRRKRESKNTGERRRDGTMGKKRKQHDTPAVATAPTTATAQQQLPQHYDQSAAHDHEGADLVQLGRQRDCVSAFTSRDWRFVAQ